MRDALEDSIERLLADQVTPSLLRASERGDFAAALWTQLEDSGYILALVDEARGGSGLRWADVYPLAVAAGRHALPLPLGEALLGAWLLSTAGIDVPPGPLSVADDVGGTPVRALRQGTGWRLDGVLHGVPWGRDVAHVVCCVDAAGTPMLALVALAGLQRRPDLNLAREPRDGVVLEGVAPVAIAPLPAALGPMPIRRHGAAWRAAQMAGAMGRAVRLSTQYASERVQFGKPIGKFQAIQQQLAVLGCEWAATCAASAYAFEQAMAPGAGLAVAAAKARAGEAAGKAASIAHATHGAIGFTDEHTLHYSTRRLWSWRSEFGHHGWWSSRIGAAVFADPSPFWDRITSGAIDVLAPPPPMETA